MTDEPFPLGMVEWIDQMLAADAAPAGQDLYPAVFDSPLFMPLQRKAELTIMMQQARQRAPQTIMEVGADKGGGLYHWVRGHAPARVIATEIRGTPYAASFERAFPASSFLWNEASSYHPATVARVDTWLGAARIDVTFLDGDKANYLKDWFAYVPLMSAGAVVFMHDIQDDGPRQAFAVARHDPRVVASWTILNTTESLVACARAARGEPSTTAYEDWLRYWAGRSCGVGGLRLFP